jgi:hypothetical protein
MDPILVWNAVALEANKVSHTDPQKGQQTGPPLSSRALAIVHLAMYDAYIGAAQNSTLPVYLTTGPALKNASVAAAVAAAAYTTLSALYSAQQDAFDQALSQYGAPLDAGHQFGVQVAKAILADRANDDDARNAGYVPSAQPGRFRIDPDNPNQTPHAPFYGARTKLFAAQTRLKLDAPPGLIGGGFNPQDNDYLEALREVRAKGIRPDLMGTLPSQPVDLFSNRRTPLQTIIGFYWAYDGAAGLGTPPRLYNLIIRKVAQKFGNTTEENAALFAFVNAAMADAGILAWEQKYIHDLWRPVTGIREHAPSLGPGATTPSDNIGDDADPFWLPLGAPATNSTRSPEELLGRDNDAESLVEVMPTYQCLHKRKALVKNFTPPFPAYPSGHATFGAAAFEITRLFYQEKGKGNIQPDSDDLFQNLSFISKELFSGDASLKGGTQDNTGTVRTTHERSFPQGLHQMIIENGESRVYLGVHWVFDAFVRDAKGKPDLSKNIGGVPLGIGIANSIFGANKKGPQKSKIGPRDGDPTELD